jgi:hypothetical protein
MKLNPIIVTIYKMRPELTFATFAAITLFNTWGTCMTYINLKGSVNELERSARLNNLKHEEVADRLKKLEQQNKK